MLRRRFILGTSAAILTALLAATALFVGVIGAAPRASGAGANGHIGPNPEVTGAVHHDVSAPLRSMTAARTHKRRVTDPPQLPLRVSPAGQTDPVVQTAPGTAAAPTVGLNFEGVGDSVNTPANPCNCAPPDTNGAVGATQYVQWVNTAFAVYSKSTGALVYGPVAGNTLWSGFGGACEINNDGDPIAQYDKAANRWVFTQFSVTTLPYLQCVAVSTTSDATGTYNRYSFSYGNVEFPDYPKLGVWPDAYYISYNIFNNGTTFAGSKACAFDRTSMLTGAPATQVCFQLSTAYGGLLPSDLDGATAPTAGTPNYFMNFDVNSLNLWTFHVDFTTPTNSTFTGPISIPVAAFNPACNGGGTCIPQGGTTQQLDSLADRLMYRLAYRKFADGHEALVVNHAVTAGASVGVRWYEIRGPGATPTVYQQGTYAPDSDYRWMGSIAMDNAGNMALGYSKSGTSLSPGIYYTGRLATDTLGLMTQGETTLQAGIGSQNGGLNRWGDYSAMSIDPVDDCTFWYTSEYLQTSGSYNWNTRIGSFKFPGCGAPATPDYSLAASPSSLSFTTGGSGTFSVSVTPSGGFNGTVNLTPSSTPAGLTVTPTSATSASPSYPATTFTASSTTAGTYTVTVTGTSGTLSHATTVTVTVNAPAAPDFTISASPSSVTAAPSTAATSTISLAALNGWVGNATLTVSAPAGVSASVSPTTVGVPGSSTLTMSSATPGTYSITVTATGTSGTTSRTHSVVVTFTVSSNDCNNC